MTSFITTWSQAEPIAERGVLVASDITLEWLLPLWWNFFRSKNTLPVAFVDLGLSDTMKTWCRERGHTIRLRMADSFVVEKEDVDPAFFARWEEAHGRQFWEHRCGWFKKPSACLLTPFRNTIWLDVDCEVRGSLEPLYAFCDHPSGFAIAEEQNSPMKGVNSGVMVFKKGLPLFEIWAEKAITQNHLYPGDQDILSEILKEFVSLPQIYNWSRCKPDNPEAVIVHWHGRHGKTILRYRLTKEQSGIL